MHKQEKEKYLKKKYSAAGENFEKNFQMLSKLRSNFQHFPKFVAKNVAKSVSTLAKNLTKFKIVTKYKT